MQNVHYFILVFVMGGISPFSGFVAIEFSILM